MTTQSLWITCRTVGADYNYAVCSFPAAVFSTLYKKQLPFAKRSTAALMKTEFDKAGTEKITLW